MGSRRKTMKTKEEVRDDLKEIRYYCSKQRDFENAAKTIGSSTVVEKVKAYNEAIQTAPIRLYDLYVSLYVNNNREYLREKGLQQEKREDDGHPNKHVFRGRVRKE